MKRTIRTRFLLSSIILGLALAVCPVGSAKAASVPIGDPNDEYYMITFMSGLEFWQDCLRGFQDAAGIYGAKTFYTGAQEFDINQQVTVLEQIIAKSPAGIAITCVNSDALIDPINNAIEQGINLVVFDADSPRSNRRTILQTSNATGGAEAAKKMSAALGGSGEVGVIFTVGTPTHEARAEGFIAEIEANHPGMKVVARGNYDGERESAAATAASMIQANPEIRGIFGVNAPCGLGIATAVREAGRQDETKVMSFDADESTYDAIRDGQLLGTVKQGSYTMGFWAMQFLFCVENKLINPVPGWSESGINPLPPYVNTGVFVIDAENVDLFSPPKAN